MEWASLKDYEAWRVIQREAGKGGPHYIRVTNIRGKRTKSIPRSSKIFSDYVDIIKNHLKIGRRPKSVEIQRLANLLIYELIKKGNEFSVADFDDGLIFIGTTFCFNHENPRCEDCPIRDLCKGNNEDRTLIEDYTT